MKKRFDVRRLATAAALAASGVMVFAALGGIGVAQSATSAAQGEYGKKVTICHKGKKTITVSKKAWPAHKRHGDTLGNCQSAAAKAKAAKIKAAKAKAAKAKAAKAKAAKAKAAKEEAAKKGEKPGKGGGKGKGK